MSRFRPGDPFNLGFFRAFWLTIDGGVTAGSKVSRPSVFLEKEVVAIGRYLDFRATVSKGSQSAGDGPDDHDARTYFPQNPRTGVGGGTRGKNVIHQYNALAR